MTEVEEYKQILEALDHAHTALQREAFEAHSKTLPKKGQLVTHDMCPCGQPTGMGRTEQCKSLRVLGDLIVAYRKALSDASAKGTSDQ